MESIEINKLNRSIYNSSKTALGIGEVFTGTAQDVDQYIQIIIHYSSDVISEINGISIEFGSDGTTWPIKKTFTSELNVLTNEYSGKIVINILDKYCRVVYTNNSTTAQTYFHLQSSFRISNDPETLIRNNEKIRRGTETHVFRLGSDYKRDVALGKIESNKNYIVNALRTNIDATEKVISPLSNDYPWPTTARRLRIKAGGNANDTVVGSGAQFVTIVGLDGNFNEIYETVATSGTSASAWTTLKFIRVNAAVVSLVGTYTGSNEGNIIIESETDLYELCIILAGNSRSLLSVYTVPRGYTACITRLFISVSYGHSISLSGYYRKNGNDLTSPYSPKVLINSFVGFSGSIDVRPEELVPFEETTDFWLTVKKDTGTGDATVNASYDLDLLRN